MKVKYFEKDKNRILRREKKRKEKEEHLLVMDCYADEVV